MNISIRIPKTAGPVGAKCRALPSVVRSAAAKGRTQPITPGTFLSRPSRGAQRDRIERLSPSAAIPHWINPESPEPFLAYNTAILLPWMLMIIAPRWEVTRKLLEPTWFMVPYALVDTVYFFATAVLDAQAGKDVNAELIFLFTDAITDPEKMLSLFNNPAYAAQDWVHLCTWDMLAGRWIWLDSLATGVPVRFALLTAFSSGPPGLLIYLISRGLFQKPEDADSQVSKV